MRRLLSCVVFLTLLPSVALAQQEGCGGCKDHPQVQRYPGFNFWWTIQNDFNSAAFTVADGQDVKKEGRFWDLSYTLKDGVKPPTCEETDRKYENDFKKGGGKLVWRSGDGCDATFSMPLGNSERWMKITNSAAANEGLHLTILEVAAMKQKVGGPSAAPPAAGEDQEKDCEGCKDLLQVPRFPGFYLTSADHNDSNAISVTVADGQDVQKEGKYWNLQYAIQKGVMHPSCLESARNYENAFKGKGGKLVWHGDDWCDATFSMPGGKLGRWIKLNNNVEGNGSMHIEVVEAR